MRARLSQTNVPSRKVSLSISLFLLARQPNGDDEVEIRCLHSCLSRTMSIASFMLSCKQFKFSCILLIHFLHGRPLLRFPGICKEAVKV